MTSGELSELSQFAKDSILEFNRSRLAPPVEYCANDFDAACKALRLDECHLPSKIGETGFANIWTTFSGRTSGT